MSQHLVLSHRPGNWRRALVASRSPGEGLPLLPRLFGPFSRQRAVSGRSLAIHKPGHGRIHPRRMLRPRASLQPDTTDSLHEWVWTAWTAVDSTLSTLIPMNSLTKTSLWTVWTAFMGRDTYACAHIYIAPSRARAHHVGVLVKSCPHCPQRPIPSQIFTKTVDRHLSASRPWAVHSARDGAGSAVAGPGRTHNVACVLARNSKKKSGKKIPCPKSTRGSACRVYRQTRAADFRAWPLHTSSSPPPHSNVRLA